MRIFLLLCLSLYSIAATKGQEITLGYYLPQVAYDPAVPTPKQFLGYEVGERHVEHGQLLAYMKALDAASDRVALQSYGRSHEGRELVCLLVTSPENHQKIDQIQRERAEMCDPARPKPRNLSGMPAVTYMGYSVHGNEASGSNAALAVAYYLAAAQSADVTQLLTQSVILLDPCFNPDGLHRFAGWVNSRRSEQQVSDPAADEYNEPWPKGRTNHYWFDLNRDWLVAQQPESVGRVALFQAWHPNILTDHHEMGSNSSFFFQPGVQTRVNPLTPKRNQELCAKIATYHAATLNERGVAFYSEENFDDFYYGKGSTYPDVQGCVGILFEQASSRGSAQDTENGLLTFPFTIRNQVLTSLSTLKATQEMRTELNIYLSDFFRNAVEDARKDAIKGYVFNNADRDLPGRAFLELLLRQGITVTNLKSELSVGGVNYPAGNAFFVPCEQAQYRLVKSIFSRQTQFQDSIFYDISAWTLPDAFGLEWASVERSAWNSKYADPDGGLALTSRYAPAIFAQSPYAYAIRPDAYEVPRVLGDLLKRGLLVKVATKAFDTGEQAYPAGTLIVPAEQEAMTRRDLLDLMNGFMTTVPIHGIDNGLTPQGPDLGSDRFRPLRLPKVLLLTGDGVRAEDAGEIWHLLDTRYGLPVTQVNLSRLGNTNLSKYNVLVLADANPGGVSSEKVKEFVRGGGTLLATGASLRWLKSADLLAIEFREETTAPGGLRRPYDMLDDDQAAKRMPGSIFEGILDLSHPICYGYTREKLPLFLSDALYVEPTKNPYATPVQLSKNPLLAGYMPSKQKQLLPSAAAISVHGAGKGRIIAFAINPNFRAFWYGTNRLFANAIFFGGIISAEATEKKD